MLACKEGTSSGVTHELYMGTWVERENKEQGREEAGKVRLAQVLSYVYQSIKTSFLNELVCTLRASGSAR